MRSVESISEALRARGLRVTPQRQLVMRALLGNDRHPTVESIFEAARAEMPTLSLKTVYQIVHDLEALGEVRLLDLGTGATRVDPNVEDDHHHLVCARCGLVRDLVLDEAPPAVPTTLVDGFTVDAVELVYRGVCRDCASG